MNPVIQLAVERGSHLTIGEMLMNAGIVILVVFAVLFLMYILISLSGKIIQGITKLGAKGSSCRCSTRCSCSFRRGILFRIIEA